MLDLLKRNARHLPALLGIGLLIGAIYVVQKEFRHLRLEDIGAALRAIPTRSLVISAACAVLAYGVLTFYDRLGTIYAGHKVSYGRVSFASFCAYALSHNIGLAAVSGAAVRYRLYAHWGLSPVEIAKVIGFCSLTFGLGGMVLGGAILWTEPESIPFFGQRLPIWSMNAIGTAMWIVVATYVILAKTYGTIDLRGHVVELPKARMAVAQVLLATVDVAVTASIFYVLLPVGHGLTWGRFLGVYLASYSAGLVANLPGGLGVFDGAMLLGLEPWIDGPHVLGAIVVFRLYYYIIPLFLAGTLFAGNEILLRGGTALRRLQFWRSADSRAASAAQPTTRWSEPDFAVAAATGAVALCGALLLSVGALQPAPEPSWLNEGYASVAQQAGEFVPSLIGAGLLVLAVGLSQRVNLAWGATIVLLLLGAAFGVAQGERLWIPAVLALAGLLVAPFRPCFYRHARLLSGPLQTSTAVPLFALIVCVLALAGFQRHVRFMTENAWWEIVLSRHSASNGLRATVALTVAIALAATWRLIRPGHVRYLPWGAEARLRLAQLGAEPPARADGLLMGETERAAIPFRRVGRVLLGLGDPAGAESDRVSAVWRLRDLAAQEGLHQAVWRAGPELLKVYGDLGMTAIPLGRDGLPLPEHHAAREFLVCVAERDLAALLPQLQALVADEMVPEAAE